VRLGLLLTMVGLLSWAGDARAEGPQTPLLLRDPVALVRAEANLSGGDLSSLERGGVIAKIVDTPDRSEVYAVAIARVNATPARAAQYLRDIDARRREPWVLQFGRLGTKPAAAEIEGLSLEPGEVKDLGRCRLSKCEVRLSAEAIERFRREGEWSGPSQASRANALFRDVLLTLATSYLGHGNDALFEYVNNDDPARVGESLTKLLQRSVYLQEAAADVHDYVRTFPHGRPADAQDSVYWVREKFWLMNVMSMNHVTVVDRATANGHLVMAVTKQLYATHYYESSLAITAFVDVRDSAGPYIIFINRTRADIRRSGFTWLERVLLKHLVRGRVEAQMKHLRAQLQGS
jgi:hypothetical protein